MQQSTMQAHARGASSDVSPVGVGIWFVVAFGGLVLAFRPALLALVGIWDTQPEYSYGYIIPFVFAFLIYQRLSVLGAAIRDGSWHGVALVAVGLALGTLGRVSTLDTVAQYGFLLSLWGLLLAFLGWRAFVTALVPFVVLAFMVPIPNYLLREMSAVLQLLSSRLGVGIIRLCGYSVYLEGNVIDLGSMKLQVVEACSGLRYLFSLMVLSLLVAYFYRARIWKRVLVFLSAIPVTLLMNSLRIALVGVTVDHYGKRAAEGILHDFEGVTIFVGCVAVLLAEIWLLNRLSGERRPFRDVLSIDIPTHDWIAVRRLTRMPPRSAWVAATLVALAAAVGLAMPERVHAKPDRPAFSGYPMQLGSWRGYPARLDTEIIDALKFDDYLLADYFDPAQRSINLYTAFYNAQANGNSAHSPKACIPGDGWEIHSFETHTVPGSSFGNVPLAVNRVLIQKGEHRALVYYWFQQRGRIVIGEYTVKLYILLDSVMRSRSDGAMVRLVTALGPSETVADADARLAAFANSAMPSLRRFIPE